MQEAMNNRLFLLVHPDARITPGLNEDAIVDRFVLKNIIKEERQRVAQEKWYFEHRGGRIGRFSRYLSRLCCSGTGRTRTRRKEDIADEKNQDGRQDRETVCLAPPLRTVTGVTSFGDTASLSAKSDITLPMAAPAIYVEPPDGATELLVAARQPLPVAEPITEGSAYETIALPIIFSDVTQCRSMPSVAPSSSERSAMSDDDDDDAAAIASEASKELTATNPSTGCVVLRVASPHSMAEPVSSFGFQASVGDPPAQAADRVETIVSCGSLSSALGRQPQTPSAASTGLEASPQLEFRLPGTVDVPLAAAVLVQPDAGNPDVLKFVASPGCGCPPDPDAAASMQVGSTPANVAVLVKGASTYSLVGAAPAESGPSQAAGPTEFTATAVDTSMIGEAVLVDAQPLVAEAKPVVIAMAVPTSVPAATRVATSSLGAIQEDDILSIPSFCTSQPVQAVVMQQSPEEQCEAPDIEHENSEDLGGTDLLGFKKK
jgi:hypothetical protein